MIQHYCLNTKYIEQIVPHCSLKCGTPYFTEISSVPIKRKWQILTDF